MSGVLSRLKYLDWSLIAGLAVLALASLLTLASIDTQFFIKQAVWYALSFFIIIFGSRIDWRWLQGQIWFRQGLYWFSIALLFASQFQTQTIRGTKSWITLGAFQFEPAELAKIALIILLADFFSRRYVAAWQVKNLALSFFYTLVPVALIALHPDFGSAFALFIIWVGFLLLSNVNKKRLLIGGLLAGIAVLAVWFFFLKPYQKDRLAAFVFPERDPLGINYNVIQSKIAIGSAGIFGKGFKGGTQTQLGFLPESHSDFLFAAFIEEWGIVGAFAVILTFLFILHRIISIGLAARGNDAKFIALGVGFSFLAYFFINVGSNLGITPVTGINFPFLSYGGSNLLTTAILIGIIERIKLESR